MPRTDETGRLAPNAARLRKIKDVTSTTKTFRQRETDRIYSFCYCQSVLLSLFFQFLDCPKNCLEYYQNGSTTDGVYWVYPDEEEPFQVLCDMTTDGGGWTTFQRRMNGSVDFYVDWESYKKGFGNLKGEFWLGNDYLHRLTASASMVFRIDMEDYEGDRRFAEYTTFAVADESDNYRVTIDGYRGSAGDSLLSYTKPIKYVLSQFFILCSESDL